VAPAPKGCGGGGESGQSAFAPGATGLQGLSARPEIHTSWYSPSILGNWWQRAADMSRRCYQTVRHPSAWSSTGGRWCCAKGNPPAKRASWLAAEVKAAGSSHKKSSHDVVGVGRRPNLNSMGWHRDASICSRTHPCLAATS
jgi:hypothetical protein